MMSLAELQGIQKGFLEAHEIFLGISFVRFTGLYAIILYP